MFFVADSNMAETFKGFLTRRQFHQSLGCAAFTFDPLQDIRHAGGIYDTLHTQAGYLLRGYQTTHNKLVVAQDCSFSGSPGQASIRENLSGQLRSVGWADHAFIVLAIDPELEQWIWQDSVHVEAVLKHSRPPSLRERLEQQGQWPKGKSKPPLPKETLEAVIRNSRGLRRSSAIYGQISHKVSVKNCKDPEFQRLVAQLRAWFPLETPT
ncbi:MAG TPA: hypothetical protein P5329_11755 [Candidatus Competibacteraceae bacterium]|nr:hypothetical protein [Candidatus Competibacteraceae bacterium]